MKLRIILPLLLALLLGFTACAAQPQQPADSPAAPQTDAPAATLPGTEAPVQTEAPLPAENEAIVLEDFTVRTIDGTDFTLSEALKDHELVLINLWATWCPPCRMEFPYLQEAWSQRSDRVAVIALSVEPNDTEEVLQDYAAEMELTFPIGSEIGTDLQRFISSGIPTSILVDRTRKVAAIEVGAKTSTQEFLDWFDGYSGEDYNPNLSSYTVCCYSGSFGVVEGVVINFCTDRTCTPVTTDANGIASFQGPPARYHVEIISVPEGYQLMEQSEWNTEPYAQTFWVPFSAVTP